MLLSSLSPVDLIYLGVAVLVIRFLVSLINSPSLFIPGPALARFTNLWYLWQMKRGDFHHTNIKLHKTSGKYLLKTPLITHSNVITITGNIIRIAPNYYSISDSSAVRTIYGHGTKFEKSEWYDAWNFSTDTSLTNLFSERTSKKHAEGRKKVASMYSMTSLVAYEPFVDNCIEIFKQRLDEFSTEGRCVDMAHWLQCYAFDVIGEITVYPSILIFQMWKPR